MKTTEGPARVTVETALRRVVDPCSIAAGVPIDLLDMGLIREVEIHASEISVCLVLTTPFCFQAHNIRKEIERVLLEIDEVEDVNVTVDAEAEWMPDMVSDEARARLRDVRPFPVATMRAHGPKPEGRPH